MHKKIILASNSPRRKELLNMLNLEFQVIPDNTPEPVDRGVSPEDLVCGLARFKGENVIRDLRDTMEAVVIAADTVVAVNDEVLGKPKDEADAERMLVQLSGRSHFVYTGVYVEDICTKKSVSFCEKTEVFFKKLDISEIKDYINTGEPMDKAGSYGIQNLGSLFVEKIDGDYFNVVGLPVSKLCQVLKENFDIKIF